VHDQAAQVVLPVIVPVVSADLVQAAQVVLPVIVPVVSADLVLPVIVQVVSADLVQAVQVADSLVPAHQVEPQVAHPVVVQVVDLIQLVAAAILRVLSVSQVADLLRVVNQSALSVKSSTT
jgi:hypothetical protein